AVHASCDETEDPIMPRLTRAIALLVPLLLLPTAAAALTIYPIDRAQILAGSEFDFKVEFDSVAEPAALSLLVNGRGDPGVRPPRDVRARGSRREGLGPDPPGADPDDPRPLHRDGDRWHRSSDGDLGRVPHGAAAGEERDPVHRRRDERGAPDGRPDPVQG